MPEQNRSNFSLSNGSEGLNRETAFSLCPLIHHLWTKQEDLPFPFGQIF
jgi:hypothetical protein